MSSGTFVRLILMFFFVISAAIPTAHAADVPQSFTLDGKLFSDAAATTALQDSAVTFTVQILDDSKTCVIYEESQSISTLASKGYFSVQVGSEVGSLVRTAGDSSNSMAQVFQNISLINGKLLSNGAACTVPPVAAKRRYVRIKILPSTLGGVARTLSPDLTIDSVPNAVIAERAETLQGLRAANVLQVNTTGTNQLSQTNLESLFTSTARFNSLTAVVDGTSPNYMRSNSAAGAQLPVMAGAPTGPNPGSIWFDSSDSKLKYQTTGGPVAVGSGSGTVSSVDFTAPSELSVTGTPITTSGTIAVAWATQTANKVFASPDGVTGTPTFRAMVANDIPNLPWSKITTGTPTTLLGYGITDAVKNNGGTPSMESGLDAAKGAATTAGRVWISTDTKQIYRDNGATWDLIGSGAPGGVTNVSSANSYLTVANGSTTPSLTVNVGTTANTVAAGDDSRITGALQQATAFTGDVSGAYNATSVDKIKGKTVSPAAYSAGQFLKYDGTNWVNSSLLASDITGALTYTPVNKAGDTMTGLLVLSADPSANLGSATKQYVDSAASTAQANAQTYADTKFITKNLPAAPAAGQNGQSIRWNNGTGAWEYYTAGTGGGDFMASGSVPMTGTLKMGGNTIYGNSTASGNLTLESTSDATKGHVVLQPTSGNVGIGTTSPSTTLDVNGAQTFRGVAAATAPPTASQGKIYYDSTANKFKVSENNGAYVDLVGGGGTVTNVTSANSYLSVANGTTTPALTLNVGTTANTVAAGDDSRITGALQQATAFSGDVSGAYNATSVDKIKGKTVSPAAYSAGQFLKYDGTNWVNSSLLAGDVTGALTYTPVNKAGDTMTGLLVLSADPSANLGSATKQYVDSAASTAQANAQTYADTKFITKNLPAAPAAGQNGQSIRWNNGSSVWEYYTPSSGSGDLVGPASATDNAIARFDGTTGKLVQNSGVVIDDSGNVGIGTTTPGAQLQTNTSATGTIGQIIKWGQAGQTANLLEFQNDTGTILARVDKDGKFFGDGSGLTGVTATPSGAAGSVQFSNGTNLASDNSNFFWDDTNNRLGIGTTSPTTRMHVMGVGGSVTSAIRIENTTGDSSIRFDKTSANFVLGIDASDNFFKISRNTALGTNDALTIDSANNVGIGVTGPTSKLQVAGDITPDTTATKNLGSGSLRWNNIYLSNAPDVSSDARLKKDVQTSDLGLDFINSLRPVSWTWKDQSQGTTQHYGVIAQETESAIAKAKGKDSSNVIVTHNEETDSYSVRYTELISPLIKAFQELYAKVMGHDEKIQAQDRHIASKADKTEVDQLKADNVAKDKKIKELEQRLEQIEKMLKSK